MWPRQGKVVVNGTRHVSLRDVGCQADLWTFGWKLACQLIEGVRQLGSKPAGSLIARSCTWRFSVDVSMLDFMFGVRLGWRTRRWGRAPRSRPHACTQGHMRTDPSCTSLRSRGPHSNHQARRSAATDAIGPFDRVEAFVRRFMEFDEGQLSGKRESFRSILEKLVASRHSPARSP